MPTHTAGNVILGITKGYSLFPPYPFVDLNF